jgi:hypothetical protein
MTRRWRITADNADALAQLDGAGQGNEHPMTRKQKRLTMILGGPRPCIGVAAGLVLYALSDTITFFHTPSDLSETGVKPGQRIRLGGMVEDGSVKRGPGTMTSILGDGPDQPRSP